MLPKGPDGRENQLHKQRLRGVSNSDNNIRHCCSLNGLKCLNNPVVYTLLLKRNLKGLLSVSRPEQFKVALQDFSSNPIFIL